VKGGRTREDGEVLEWLISAPRTADGRGVLPFFCGDLTPRGLRVPLDPPSNTEHANTALRVAHVRLLAPPNRLNSLSRQLTTVLGVQPVSSGPTESIWVLDDVPSAVAHEHDIADSARLILSAPQSDDEQEYVRTRGASIYEVGFVVKDGGKSGEESTPYGRVVWIRT